MDLKEKVTEALRESFTPDHVILDDDEGISGIVVSSRFRRMSAIDRQLLIDKSLRESRAKLTKSEWKKILAIAALTPAEFETLDFKERLKKPRTGNGAR